MFRGYGFRESLRCCISGPIGGTRSPGRGTSAQATLDMSAVLFGGDSLGRRRRVDLNTEGVNRAIDGRPGEAEPAGRYASIATGPQEGLGDGIALQPFQWVRIRPLETWHSGAGLLVQCDRAPVGRRGHRCPESAYGLGQSAGRRRAPLIGSLPNRRAMCRRPFGAARFCRSYATGAPSRLPERLKFRGPRRLVQAHNG